MENYKHDHYKSIEKALYGIGLKIEDVQKQKGRTVIIVCREKTVKNQNINTEEQRKNR